MELIVRQEDGFSFRAQMDQVNRRIWVQDYSINEPSCMGDSLFKLTLEHGLEKIIFPVKKKDIHKLVGIGFVEEGVIEGYFNGQDAHFLTAYTTKSRGNSDILSEEHSMLQEILAHPLEHNISLPKGFRLSKATRRDARPMAILFSKVFSTYPSPVFDPFYLTQAISKGDIYMVIYNGANLAGVAAAEIDWGHSRAEITNCATHPDYRGMGLNTILLDNLLQGCRAKGIHCLYSLARASSYGMNLVLHRQGYKFRGTLINNCNIAGRYEDMNIWVKPPVVT